MVSWLQILLPRGSPEQALLIAALMVFVGLAIVAKYLVRVGGVRYQPKQRAAGRGPASSDSTTTSPAAVKPRQRVKKA